MITSLGLERRPVLSTPHRVNLAGRGGHQQRELTGFWLKTKPCQDGRVSPGCSCHPVMHLTTITQVIKYAVQSLLLLPGGSWAVICCLEDTA